MTDAEIRMSLPAESRFVATARVTTASLAAELDFGVDQIEELRVGANELIAILVEWAEDHGADRVELTYRISTDSIELVATVAPDDTSGAEAGSDPLDQLTRQILAAVVDQHEIRPGWGRIVKSRAAT